jgi:putative transcriptional regulator
VQSDRGFVLHTPKEGYTSSMRLNNDLMVTTSRDILEKLTTEDAPEKFILALGYAGWSAGQLEKEMAENSWLMIPADNNIIFEMSHAEKWQGAAHTMGIEVWQLSPEAGHA